LAIESATLRPATERDLFDVARMASSFLRSVETYGAVIPNTPAHIDRVSRTLLEHGVIVLAERHGIAVGMIAGLVYPDLMTTLITISELWWWVDEDVRGTGIAEVLLERFELWGREHGATRAQIGSRHRVLDRYYKRFGYAPIERIFVKELVS